MDAGTSWERARDIFLDLADSPDSEREATLDRLADSEPDLVTLVRKLLRHDTPPPADRNAGRRFGPYQVTRRIGTGGMGDVFIGRRADGEYEREVAIKLLRSGAADDGLVQRFLRERQTLASLDHEYIARLLDGGTTEEGEPFLVMEYVEGEPADVFAARLDVPDRLDLFLRIGHAVAHAHERGVVHRDLKPSNILVREDGTPRLLDFGIARTRHPGDEARLTHTGHRMFTPEYASPEQIRGDSATTSSDVFALGVLLHVFLTGRSPWPAHQTLGDLERSICAFDPPAPSRSLAGTARRHIARDLDAITLQCLAKQPERRYATVTELCKDIERHLHGQPIRARRTGVLTRASRYARRRPLHLVAAALALVALTVTTVWLRSQHDDRQRQDELATAVSDRIENARTLWVDGRADAAFAELDAADDAIERLPDDPALHAAALAQRAVFLSLQQHWQPSIDLADQALRHLHTIPTPDPIVMARALNTRAYSMHRQAPDGSEPHSRAALEHARAHLSPGDVLHADALLGWSDELRFRGRHDDAQRFLDEAVAEIRQQNPRAEIAARFLNDQALAFARRGDLDAAADRYRQALDILSWHRGERNPSVGKVRFNLGATLYRAREFEAAQREFELALTTWRSVGDDTFIADTQQILGRIAFRTNRLPQAEAAAREALELRTRSGDEVSASRSRCLLAIVRAARGETAQAEPILADALADLDAYSLPDEMVADARVALGRILQAQGLDAEARAQFEEALVVRREQLGPTHPDCEELEHLLEGLR